MEENNNFFAQGMNMQKSMMDMWSKTYDNLMSMSKNYVGASDEMPVNVFRDSADAYANFMSSWGEQFKQYQLPQVQNFFNFQDQQDVLQKLFTSQSVYQDLFSFWKELAEKAPYDSPEKVKEFAEQWQEKYVDITKNFFIPMLPENLKTVADHSSDLMQEYAKFNNGIFQPWVDNAEELKDVMARAMKGDKEAISEFFKSINSSYDQSFGKIFNIAGLGLNRESFEQQMQSYDSYVKYMISFNELYSMVYKVSVETMEKLVKQYQEMYSEGKTPQTFKEFYDMWWKTNENAFIALFSTSEFSQLFGKFSEKFCDFKIKSDRLIEMQLKALPLPSKTDMDGLYKTVYEQKKEIRALKKAVNDLKAQITASPAQK